ncbi:MAG TPA: M24 family metallopeptidase [Arenicellales bacterium]|nr:M24 family metallopeptidase [Arenicellales bacterium]
MPPPFPENEYQRRLAAVRARMSQQDLDLLLVNEPANINYLTGYDGWSFYVPQLVALPLEDAATPTWIGRQMDTAQAPLTSWLPADHVVGYPETYVQATDRHPMDWIANHLRRRGWGDKRIGVETDAYYFSPRAMDHLRAGLPDAVFIDADLLVNRVRAVKSDAELACMRAAARLAGRVMQTAYETIHPGLRQCDAMAAIMAAQIGGDPEFSGDVTGLLPLIMSGRAAAAPHPIWTAEPFEQDQTTALELGGACRHYNAGLARTLHCGDPPRKLVETARIVEEGLEAALATMRAGVAAEEVEAAWRRVLQRHGLRKESRIGYGIGLGYPPDWGERTISLRPGERTALAANNTLHLMLGMWMDGWGMEMSETVLITDHGAECLTRFPRGLMIRK